jgi:uncharacterized protein (DUF1330 family)
MSAYCLFDNVEVLDPDGLARYARRIKKVVERYGGRHISIGGTVEAVEGDQHLRYPVLIEFPDLEAAHRWYDAPDYKELKALRHASVRCNATFFSVE